MPGIRVGQTISRRRVADCDSHVLSNDMVPQNGTRRWIGRIDLGIADQQYRVGKLIDNFLIGRPSRPVQQIFLPAL